MKEKKMTDKEIVKALKLCANGLCNKNCPAWNLETESECQDYMNKLVLNLINRQKAEIERLKKSNKNILFVNDQVIARNDELQKQVEYKSKWNIGKAKQRLQGEILTKPSKTRRKRFLRLLSKNLFSVLGQKTKIIKTATTKH